ncbi:hypothetical protein FPZ24_06920 [Sphingomonas panacisoli]|uniref:Uncharacterized protein n=1 Tax=Sphingomonas panacisoli TaxID=1813879 RepID=A0A5B8LHY3_9SPHN|nr:hypothetical protein FPZ24_06920 [Sphingomonas panacisoli]
MERRVAFAAVGAILAQRVQIPGVIGGRQLGGRRSFGDQPIAQRVVGKFDRCAERQPRRTPSRAMVERRREVTLRGIDLALHHGGVAQH